MINKYNLIYIRITFKIVIHIHLLHETLIIIRSNLVYDYAKFSFNYFINMFLLPLIYISFNYYNKFVIKQNINKYNLAFYTCFYGSSNNEAFMIPSLPSENYDCYYFSNNKNLLEKINETKWIGIFDDKLVTDNLVESCFYGKQVKVIPETFDILNKYDYTCFLDSKLPKVSEAFVENFIYTYFILQDYALLLREHVFIQGNIWNEFNVSMHQARYSIHKDQIKTYIDKQIKDGFSEKTPKHCQCGFLIRNMKHPEMKKLNNTWYSHIQECGIQDQISFFFVKQLFEKDILPFKEVPFIIDS